jgi:hypothetical protein
LKIFLSGLLVCAGAVTAQTNTGYRCLPSCNVADGRFLAIAGSNFQTLSPPELGLEIAVPAGSAAFQIGVFDGDGGEYQSDGVTANWDSGVTARFEYSLAADPTADGTGTLPVDLAPGQAVIDSSTMPDNDWRDFTVPTGPAALAPSGNYFYVLRIRLIDPSLTTLNAFKVRSTTTVTGLTVNPVPRPFSYIAPFTALSDLAVIYPSFPAATPTTYDGVFRFYMDVPTTQHQIALWDGDFDHGSFDHTSQDTDDPDTPNAPFLPVWSTPEVVSEGVANGLNGTSGNPSDNDDPAGFGALIVRDPAIRYDLRFPDGQVFANDNPSGNLEWEQFRISTDPFDGTQMDGSTASLPPGTYQLVIQGVDMLNLNSLLLPFRVLCVDELGVPCLNPPRPYRVGDTVFQDLDGNGLQSAGEPGIPGVSLELYDAAGALLGTTTTDAGGHYSFQVEADLYEVAVAAANSAPGGPLAGYTATTLEQRTATVTIDNVLTYDFGYRAAAPAPGTGTIGYWKTHPSAWPVSTITAGGVVYTRDQAIAWLGAPSRGDKSIDLFKQLVAAKLNVLAGNDASCISSTIAAADAWMGTHPPGSGVKASSAAWATASPWHTALDDYNNGQLCAPHRS